jgi:hypothetical protein
MNKILSLILLSTLLLNAGCAYSHRHPKQVKVGLIAIGAAAGVGVGLAVRGHGHCPNVYDGRPYSGTPPCPVPDKDK